MRNIEIKAKLRNLASVMQKASNLSGSKGTIIKQYDTFYNVNQGRLKLRKFEAGDSELIYYERPDVEGPKLCSYKKVSLNADTTSPLHELLLAALGPKTDVKKVRHLFLVGQTRIHIDSVDGLGNFLELEVVLKDDQTPEEGQKIAQNLMKELEVEEQDLISGAYADMK